MNISFQIIIKNYIKKGVIIKMKVQIEKMAYLMVFRILGKTFTRCRSYLLLDNRKWNDRELTQSEINRFKRRRN